MSNEILVELVFFYIQLGSFSNEKIRNIQILLQLSRFFSIEMFPTFIIGWKRHLYNFYPINQKFSIIKIDPNLWYLPCLCVFGVIFKWLIKEKMFWNPKFLAHLLLFGNYFAMNKDLFKPISVLICNISTYLLRKYT